MIIDIHGHITPPELLKKYPMPPALGDIDGMIEQKANAGIEMTIVGSPVGFGTMMPVPGLDNFAQPLDQLKSFHGWLAETVVKYPGRLKAYCFTNPFGGDRMLEETAKTVKEGGFVGLIVNTSVKGQYLDSEGADPFFAMAAELDVPIFLHPPAEPVGSGSLQDFRVVEQVGRFCDVTVSLATLVFGGRMEQYPNLQFIGATAGGAISLLPSRLDMAYQPRHYGGRPGGGPPVGGPPAAGPGPGAGPGGPPGAGPAAPGPPAGGPMIKQYQNKITQPPSTFIKRIWVDTATFSVPGQVANLEMMGADHMLFGTDSPPLAVPLQATIDMVNSLPISDGDKRKIFSENAKRLFKLET